MRTVCRMVCGLFAGLVAFSALGQTYTAKQVLVIDGLDKPECVLLSPAGDTLFVANIETSTEGWWEEDGKAFLSRISPDGKSKKLRWVDSSPKAPLNAPKGMCILDGYLYFADVTKLKRVSLEKPKEVKVISLPGAEQLNDVATDGKAVYVADSAKHVIYRVDPAGGHTVIKGPKRPNGITFHEGHAYVLSFADHEVYEFDPAGKKKLIAFGLADHFKGLDGIEVLDDGTFIISDLVGNKVCAVSPNRKKVITLAELQWPADISVDRKKLRLYVPQVKDDRVVVFELVGK